MFLYNYENLIIASNPCDSNGFWQYEFYPLVNDCNVINKMDTLLKNNNIIDNTCLIFSNFAIKGSWFTI